MNKTTAVKAVDINAKWHFIDAKDQILGRLATQVAKILTGKNKATFSYNVNLGDKVVITNAEKIKVTGKKLTDKLYIWYTGFPGGLRSTALKDKLAKNPTSVLHAAVNGMLPKNRLQRERINNLYIYAGETHPHTSQKSVTKDK